MATAGISGTAVQLIGYYDAIINSNPSLGQYRQGWYDRVDRMVNVFFDVNYGNMPIDAVNGRVII